MGATLHVIRRMVLFSIIVLLSIASSISCSKHKSPTSSKNPKPPTTKTLKYVGSTFWRGINDVEIKGDYAYCAMTYGLSVLNISDPSSIQHVSHLYLPAGVSRRITLNGDYAYLIGPGGGLQIIDISEPSNPVKVGECQTPGAAVNVAIVGSYAYVADGYAHVQIIDISSPSSPRLLGGLNIGYYATSIVIRGDYAYVSDLGSAGLWILNVSNPAAPTISSNFATPDWGNDVVLTGNYALLANTFGDNNVAIRIVNIADPNSPQPVDSMLASEGGSMELAISGNYAYALMGSTVRVIDLSAGVDKPVWGVSFGSIIDGREITVEGARLYISDYEDGLYIYSLANPAAPVLEARTGLRGAFMDVAVKGNYAFAAAGIGGFRVIDVSDPANPNPEVFYKMPNAATAVTIEGNYAYVSDLTTLEIINISNPLAPSLAGSYVTGPNCHNISIVDHYAFIAAGPGGLHIVDISNAGSPKNVSIYLTGSPARDVVVDDTIAYIAGEQYLEIISIANLQNPYFISRVNWSLGYYGHIAIKGHFLLVGEIVIFDVSNPKAPVWMSGATPGQGDVTVQGDWAIWTWGDGIEAHDISGLPNPYVGEWAYWQGAGSIAMGIASDSNYIYLAGDRAFVILKLE